MVPLPPPVVFTDVAGRKLATLASVVQIICYASALVRVFVQTKLNKSCLSYIVFFADEIYSSNNILRISGHGCVMGG